MLSPYAKFKITVLTCLGLWTIFAVIWQFYLDRKGKEAPWHIEITTLVVVLFGCYKITEYVVTSMLHPQ